MKDDLLYVEHVLECVGRIEKYCRQGESAFFSSELIQDAVLRNLQIVAESTKRLSAETRSSHPEVDWHGVIGFRNVLVHDYLNVNLKRVWEIVSLDLPAFKAQMESIRRDLPKP